MSQGETNQQISIVEASTEASIEPSIEASLPGVERPVRPAVGFSLAQRLVIAAVLIIISVWITSDAWRDIKNIALVDEQSSQILVVPVAVGLLLLARRRRFATLDLRASWLGPVLMGAGGAMWLLSMIYEVYSTWYAGPVVMAVGCLVTVFGVDILRKFAPAFIVLVFLIPIPRAGQVLIAQPMQDIDEHRARELAAGFAQGCIDSGAVWGGGETPALKGLICPETIVLAGSAVGTIQPKSRLVQADIKDGDAIVFLSSSGVHTNGLTLCRAIADRLPDGFQTPVTTTESFGELLLKPSVIYAQFVQQVLDAKLRARYFVHMTGHGWRKLMRPESPWVFRIDRHTAPGESVPPLFEFIMKHGPVARREAYATFNMGVGWAVYLDPDDAEMCVRIARSLGHQAWVAGRVMRKNDRRAVEIPGEQIVFEADTLSVR